MMDFVSETRLKRAVAASIQISNDIFRNEDDAEFAASGGEIIYCFDSTVFGFFLNPVRSVDQFDDLREATLHKLHSLRANPVSRHVALATSEHLFTGKLPGQHNSHIYISPWHNREHAASMRAILDNFNSEYKDNEHFKGEVEDEIERKLEIINKYRSNSDFDAKSIEQVLGARRRSILKNLKPDFEWLRSEGVGEDVVGQYEKSRLAASVLLTMEHSEKLDQIHRLVSSPMMRKIKHLENRFSSVLSNKESIHRAAALWYSKILEQMEATFPLDERSDAAQRRSHRRDRGIWRDAYTLASIEAIDKTLDPTRQRIAFVTADLTLIDAYRRSWTFSKNQNALFLIRRLTQFIPLLNLSTALSDSGHESKGEEVNALFQLIKQAVELLMLPFNLATLGLERSDGQNFANSSIMRGREYFALRARDRRLSSERFDPGFSWFVSTLGDSWREESQGRLTEIRELWGRLEKLSLGFAAPELISRLNDSRYTMGSDNIHVDAPSNYIADFKRLFTSSLDRLSISSTNMYVPLALQFLREASNKQTGPNRFPSTIWYKLKNGGPALRFIKNLNHSEVKKSVEDSQISATEVFYISSLFALSHKEWWRADEFAGQAAASLKVGSKINKTELTEVLFLQAMTKRFRLGGINTHLEGEDHASRMSAITDARARVYGLHSEALAILDRIVSDLPSKEEMTWDRACHEIRGRSERAATNLFAAASIGLAERRRIRKTDSQSGTENRQITWALNTIENAVFDIVKCHETLSFIEKKPNSSRMPAIEEQYMQNAAAAEAIKYLISPESYEIDPRLDFAARFSELGKVGQSKESRLLQAEVLVFRILRGMASMNDIPRIDRIIRDDFSAQLSLDRAILWGMADLKLNLLERL